MGNATKDALHRHRPHISTALARAKDAAKAIAGDDLHAKVRELEGDARRIEARAEAAGDLRTAIAALRELRGVVELLAELRGELGRAGAVTVNITTSPAWTDLRGWILAALAAHPDARIAVARALAEESKLAVTFAGGSRIVSLPGAEGTVRGFSGVPRARFGRLDLLRRQDRPAC